MKTTRAADAIMCALAAVALAGCGGGPAVRIRADKLTTRPPAEQPVIVKNFSAAGAAISGKKADQARIGDARRDQLRDSINAALVGGLRNAGFSAMAFIEGATAPDDALIVDGILREIGGSADSVPVVATVRLYMAGAPQEVLAEFDVTNSGEGPGSWDDLAKMAAGNVAKTIVDDYFLRKPAAGQAR